MTELETNEKTTNMEIGTIRIAPQPPIVGGYRFGNHPTNFLQFNLTYKPKWFHRLCMRTFLGMYWHDGIN